MDQKSLIVDCGQKNLDRVCVSAGLANRAPKRFFPFFPTKIGSTIWVLFRFIKKNCVCDVAIRFQCL